MDDSIKQTPLYQEHVELGAKIVDFGGWAMPVQYSGIIEEHNAVRNQAGLFDVSHMGEILIKGSNSLDFLQRLVTNNVAKMIVGQCQYNLMCYPSGGVVDDLLIYKFDENNYLLVVNAGNKDKDYSWILAQRKEWGMSDVEIEDQSDQTGQIALQGPHSEEILASLTDVQLEELRYYQFTKGKVAGIEALISRTGYTGEDGFEIYVAAEKTRELWQKVLAAGKSSGLIPAGLGARDTLRFEAKMPLYGHELNAERTPIEAGLGMFVSLDKGEFNGREVIAEQKASGAKHKLVGFRMIERGVARAGYVLAKDGRVIGEVTTGSFSPTLKANLGLGYVLKEEANPGNEINVIIRDKGVKAEIIPTPFYKRHGDTPAEAKAVQ